jgi:hypothetical protein
MKDARFPGTFMPIASHEKINAIVDAFIKQRNEALEEIARKALLIDPEPKNWHWRIMHDEYTLIHSPCPPVGFQYPDL